MPWLKIDDGFTDHRKIEALTDRGFRLHVAGMCYCARTLSDGFIPEDRVKRLLPSVTKGMVKELVDAECWRKVENGYEVVGYLDYNPSKEKILDDRAKAADRKAKFLARKAAEEAKKNADKNGVPNNAQNGAPSNPTPTQPVGHWVGVEGSQANESSPSPSAGVAAAGSPAPAHEVVRAIADAVRANHLKPKPIPGPEGSKVCPCDLPWDDCVGGCPELDRAIERKAARA